MFFFNIVVVVLVEESHWHGQMMMGLGRVQMWDLSQEPVGYVAGQCVVFVFSEGRNVHSVMVFTVTGVGLA
jgi:hypothetical protein